MKYFVERRPSSKHHLVIFRIAAFLLSSCQPSDDALGWNASKQMYFAQSDDPEMETAKREGRKTVGQFLTALSSGDTTANNFGVKAAFLVDDGTAEHIWLTNIRAEGDSIFGAMNNEPDMTTAVKFGQRVAVHKDSITD